MTSHPDLTSEQAYVEHSYDRLDAMRANAEAYRDRILREGAVGTPQAVHEREVMVRKTIQRLEQLDIGDASLCFGRIDHEDDQTFYIGRVAVSGENQEPLIVDWRVPVAEPFYRATGRYPLGLRRRRHFASEGRKLTAIEDEFFAGEGSADGELGLAGTGTLLAALERSRTGKMRDIVATVQREQDEIIRAELPGVLAVQGGPGTGKTAVALHRAAYLLFTYRRQLGGREGVLVIGPNGLFLRYIDQVLPALGESGVELSTVRGLVPGVKATATEPAAVARVKGDPRMAKVLAKAVADRERSIRREVTVWFEGLELRITRNDTAAAVATARRVPGTHNQRRRTFESALFRRLFSQLDMLRRRAGRGPLEAGSPEELGRYLRGEELVFKELERMWPVLTPQELLHDLLGAPALIASAGANVLTERESELLHRPRQLAPEDVEWTPGDIALLDEADMLLGTYRRRVPSDEDDMDERLLYGHIIVDEVQDLTPMQLRMLSRRSANGSMTIVGDIAQATGDWAPSSWDDVLEHLPDRRGSRMAELSINYRTPAEVMELAGRVLRRAAPGLPVPQSIRTTGDEPSFVRVAPEEVETAVARRARDESEEVGDGTVAIIAVGSQTDDLCRALDDESVPYGEASRQGLEAPITLVPVSMVKGLEFDAVVVVEPARLVRESPQGLRALFVALTRATKRLTVIYSEDLPRALR